MKISAKWPSVVITFFVSLFICSGYTTLYAEQHEQVVKITAKRFEYSPKEITLKKGVPVILEITALDRVHGFNCPDLEIRADLLPGKVTSIHMVPKKAGSFSFHCDIFCGDGHEDMTGTITVKE